MASSTMTRARGYDHSVNHTFVTRRIVAPSDAIDASVYLRSISGDIGDTLREGLRLHASIRWTLRIVVVFERNVEGEAEEVPAEFSSDNQVLLRDDEIDAQIEGAIDKLNEKIGEFLEMGSGFVFVRLENTIIKYARYNPIGGSSYIPTPNFIAAKKAIINIQNRDDELCFLYCVAAALHPAK